MDPGLAVVFAGTPDFAVPSLEAITSSRHRLVAVFTQPDRPSGRGRRSPQARSRSARSRSGFPCDSPTPLRDDDAREALASFAPDVMVVVAYGLLLPADVPRAAAIRLPQRSCLAAAALAGRCARCACDPRGRRRSGRLHHAHGGRARHGPVMLARELAIGARTTAGELELRLAEEGGAAIVAALDALDAGTAKFTPQDPRLAHVRRQAFQGRGAARLARGRGSARAARARAEPAPRRGDDARRRAAAHLRIAGGGRIARPRARNDSLGRTRTASSSWRVSRRSR